MASTETLTVSVNNVPIRVLHLEKKYLYIIKELSVGTTFTTSLRYELFFRSVRFLN